MVSRNLTDSITSFVSRQQHAVAIIFPNLTKHPSLRIELHGRFSGLSGNRAHRLPRPSHPQVGTLDPMRSSEQYQTRRQFCMVPISVSQNLSLATGHDRLEGLARDGSVGPIATVLSDCRAVPQVNTTLVSFNLFGYFGCH